MGLSKLALMIPPLGRLGDIKISKQTNKQTNKHSKYTYKDFLALRPTFSRNKLSSKMFLNRLKQTKNPGKICL